jgi:hypothetical protein
MIPQKDEFFNHNKSNYKCTDFNKKKEEERI